MVKNADLSPPLAEAYAILGGLRLAKDLGLDRIVVRSDCLEVVNAVRNEIVPPAELGTLLEDIKVRRLNFYICDFSFLPRSCNVAAHDMARFALRFDSDSRWLGVVSPCALRDVINDQIC